jgi:hypothetical protein
MGMELKGQDFDQDGYTDIFINISYKPTGSNVPVAADLIWFNRTSGLARDPGQPEKALADLVNPASALLARDIDQALAKAEHVLAVHRVLCRESGMARFAVGDSNGIACGLSAAAGKAAAVKTAALAKKGQFYKALAAYSALNFRAFRVDETDRRLASDALNAMAPVANAAWQEGPSHQLAPGPAVRLSAIAFIDENTLVLRGPVPLVYDLTTGALTPAERSQGNTLVRDPSERYAIVQIFRGCEGYKLRIVDAALARVARPESEKIVSEPLIEARPVPAGAGCSERPAIPSADDGGFRVLGWGAKGIVLAKAGRLWLLTVDTEAQALSEPVALAPNRPPPGPLWAGALAPGGRAYALLTAVGIVVKELASPPTSYLLRPPQWDYARTTDAAVSPSGKKVALLSGGRVTIATVTPNPNP